MMMRVEHDRVSDFPLLAQRSAGRSLVYLDSAATTQKPQAVIDAICRYYQQDNANVHRGIYALSERATAAFENARRRVQSFVNAPAAHEIIFTRGTTEAINLVAQSLGTTLQAGDEILVSVMEHHSNIVPWQMLCERVGAILKVIPMCADGTLDMVAYHRLLNAKTKIVSVAHVSNVLGTVHPVQALIQAAHAYGARVLLDGAQAAGHLPVDVQALDCDFYAFSGHKLYGPTGIGVLYGKTTCLEAMPPYQGGGDMIRRVTFEKTEYQSLPNKFEAGTPPIAAAVGLAAAIEYVTAIGWERLMQHEQSLLAYAHQQLQSVPGLRCYGVAPQKIGIMAFTLRDIHPHDIATVLDSEHIAVRAGHHCAMPLMTHLQVPALVRLSLGLYNTSSDIDRLHAALYKAIDLLGAPHG